MLRTKLTEIKGLVYRGVAHIKRVLHIKRRSPMPMGTYRGVVHRIKITPKAKKATLIYRGVKYTK